MAGVLSSVSAGGLSVVPRKGLSLRCAAMAEGTPATPIAQYKKNNHTNGATRARSFRWVDNGALASVTRSRESRTVAWSPKSGQTGQGSTLFPRTPWCLSPFYIPRPAQRSAIAYHRSLLRESLLAENPCGLFVSLTRQFPSR